MVKAEDLLIFKLREKGRNAAAIEKPQTEEAARAEPKAEAAPLQRPQIEEAATTARSAEPVQKPEGAGFTFAGILVGKKKEAAQPKEARMEQQARAAQLEEEHAAETQKRGAAPEKEELVMGNEREGAKGRFCEWHPWRPAYALCDFCHRPFCYEDIVELGRGYYCLEDVDKVSENFAQQLYASYSNVSFISAGLLMLAFVAFVYFASGQLVYIFNAIMSTGWPAFIAHLNYSYGSALLGLGVAGAGIVSALFILIQSSKGFAAGLVTGLAETVLFSYQFLSSGALYMAMLSAMGLVALMLLAYSKISYEVPEQLASEQSIYHNSLITNNTQQSKLSF